MDPRKEEVAVWATLKDEVSSNRTTVDKRIALFISTCPPGMRVRLVAGSGLVTSCAIELVRVHVHPPGKFRWGGRQRIALCYSDLSCIAAAAKAKRYEITRKIACFALLVSKGRWPRSMIVDHQECLGSSLSASIIGGAGVFGVRLGLRLCQSVAC